MPKGGASSLTPVYAGLREDLDAFLRSYLQFPSIRFADYKKLFEHRGMVQLFNGRGNSAEIIEFNECLLVHCLPYMEEHVCPGIERSLKERLFGLYSLYTFFYIQPENHVVKVRMDPDAVRNFKKLTDFLLHEKIFDAYMICLKLLQDKAIKHVAFITIHDPSNFKRFYTDDKVSGVALRTNLNDPLGNVKALIESDTFKKLGYVRKEYIHLRDRSGIFGCQLEDVQEKMRGIIRQYSKTFENCLGVDEMINTDHTSDQLASRGMLRSSIKDQAHSADLKLARYRRHRSSIPLEMPTDTFDYLQEFIPEIKNVKRIKREKISPLPEELPGEPPSKRMTRQAIKNRELEQEFSNCCVLSEHLSHELPICVDSEIPEKKPDKQDLWDNKMNLKRSRRIGNIAMKKNMDEIIVKDEEKVIVEKPYRNTRARAAASKIAPEIQTTAPEMIKNDVDEEQYVVLGSEKPMTTSPKTPKSILMSTQNKKEKRHVSFRMNKEGNLDNTFYCIPSRSLMEIDEQNELTNTYPELEDEPTERLFTLVSESTSNPIKAKRGEVPADQVFDDADMFKDLEDDAMELDLPQGSESDSDIELLIDEDM